LFNRILAGVILAVAIFLVFSPKYDSGKAGILSPKQTTKGVVIFFLIGIYGGFIQVGTGFVILMVLSRLHRFSLIKSNAAKTVIIMIYSISALLTFAYYGNVHWAYGITLAGGAAAGAWFGSRWAVRKGDKIVRIFLLIAMMIMAVKLWIQNR